MKDSIFSVLIFPYGNQIEVRVTRAYAFNERPTRINIYHAKYIDRSSCESLARWASKLNALVIMKMVDSKVSIGSSST